MTIRKSVVLSAATITLLVAACIPDLPAIKPADTPSAPPVQSPLPGLSPSVPVSPVSEPDQPSAPIQQADRIVSVAVHVPAAAFTRMRAGLRILSAVPAVDLNLDEARRLTWSFAGQPLAPADAEITTMTYDEAANFIMTCRLRNVQGPGVLRLATPDGGFVMLARNNGGEAGFIRVDATSTASVLLDQSLEGLSTPSGAERQTLLAMVERQVWRQFTASRPGSVESNDEVLGLLQRIRQAVTQQQPLDAASLSQIETPPSLGGGGGGAAPPPVACTIDNLPTSAFWFRSNGWKAQKFITGGCSDLAQIKLWLDNMVNGTPVNVTVDVVAVNGDGNPDAAVLGTSNMVAVAGGGMSEKTFTFTPAVTLDPATSYFFVVKPDGFLENNWYDSNSYADGFVRTSNNSGAAWNATYGTKDIFFQLIFD